MLAQESTMMKKANDTITIMEMSPRDKWLYDSRMKYEHDRASCISEGYRQGIDKGAYQTKLETAKMMKLEAFDLSMIAKITGLSKEEIEKLKAEIEEWKNEYLRKQAEFQNFTKRKEKEVEELKKFSSEKIITQFLGSLDNLERAIESSIESKDFDSLLKGIEMIVRNLKDIMSAEGVEEIKTEGVYDPVYHHAVGVEANENFKDDEIVKVLQKGYMMKGKVIRPAMVIVCKNN